jgi:hypothetical protein
MDAPELRQYSIGEFASYKLVQDKETRTFTITVQGDLKYAQLLAHKIANLTVSEVDIAEFVER